MVKVIEIEGRPIPSEFQPLGGVAVVAQNTWAAIKGREALVVEWDAGVNGGYDSVAYRKQLEEAARKPGKAVRDSGDAAALFAKGGDIVEAEYTCRTWPRRRWNRRYPPPGTRTAPARSGPRPRRRK